MKGASAQPCGTMGQEMSCASRGKPFGAIEDGIDATVRVAEDAADALEQAIDDACRYPPATPSCELSDKERTAAIHLFWVLVHQQGEGGVSGSMAVAFEDLTMARCLHRLGVLDLHDVSRRTGPSSSAFMDGDDAEKLLQVMLRRLHVFPVGQWLRADPSRRQYNVNEWVTLVRLAQNSPRGRRPPRRTARSR